MNASGAGTYSKLKPGFDDDTFAKKSTATDGAHRREAQEKSRFFECFIFDCEIKRAGVLSVIVERVVKRREDRAFAPENGAVIRREIDRVRQIIRDRDGIRRNSPRQQKVDRKRKVLGRTVQRARERITRLS
jgi:hypothetical protein